MWNYFRKKEVPKTSPSKGKEDVFNWCLFIPKDLSISSGVFFSSIGPGIKDYKNGMLYIAPQKLMPKIKLARLSSHVAKKAILEYYGVCKHEPKKYNDSFCFKEKK